MASAATRYRKRTSGKRQRQEPVEDRPAPFPPDFPPERTGRPSTYKDEYARQALKLCEMGATDSELAEFFQTSITTLQRWKATRPEFHAACKTGKDAADERIKSALYHRAAGYTYDSEKVFQHQGVIVRAPTQEHVPPDVTAAIFWLKNRKPDEWRDVNRHEHMHRGPEALESLSAQSLAVMVAQQFKALGVDPNEAARLLGSGGADIIDVTPAAPDAAPDLLDVASGDDDALGDESAT